MVKNTQFIPVTYKSGTYIIFYCLNLKKIDLPSHRMRVYLHVDVQDLEIYILT